jgi:hypothetical protein
MEKSPAAVEVPIGKNRILAQFLPQDAKRRILKAEERVNNLQSSARTGK